MVIRPSSQCNDLAAFQRGIVARWQVSDWPADLIAIDGLLRRGRWQDLYRGVYAAYTGPVSREAAFWAAVLRCGPEAALSHFSAAELDGLVHRPSDAIHVTIPASKRVWISDREFTHDRPRIVVHRSDRLPAARHPARTPPRTRIEETVLDLANASETFDAAFSWLSIACGRRLVTPDQLRVAVAARTRMRWRTDVLIAVGEISEGILSHLERGYLRKVERPHGLPRPQRQARMANGGRSAYLDNLYGDFGLGVELDGAVWHPAESRWQDIHRDNALAGSGIITLRYNWADVTTRPCLMAAEIAQALRQRGWSGTLRACGASCAAALPSGPMING